ncbi:Fibrobacter succinogenes major domain (Fib_succ_major) [Elizabethkingia miricola]|nr:Fibrobacter succinogenes major domain (Fib_succ_major) [Elizabethkingia miricola]
MKLSKIRLVLLVLLIIVTACRNSDTGHHPGNEPVAVKMNMKGTEYEDSGKLGSLVSSGKSAGSGLPVQRQNIQLTKDLVLTVELVPDTASVQENTKTSRNGITAVETGDLAMGVLYKVVVFDANGVYATERDYIRGQEDSAQALMLDGGSSYTFIVYSVNTSVNLPPVTFSNPNNKTLATSSVTSPIMFLSDVMYFRKDITVSGNGTNYLDVVLKHKMSQVITTIDASVTNYTVSVVNAEIGNTNTGASMQLSDGNIIRGGSTGRRPLVFDALNTAIVKANPVILNTNAITNGSVTFSKLSMASSQGATITQNDFSINNLIIAPGVKYNLNLTVTPNDTYLVYRGIPAARINGQIWMRHNLGTNYNLQGDGVTPVLNPDTPQKALYGNIYQWGRSAVVANADTPAGAIGGWNTTHAPDGAWNTGTAANPVKTAQDPCPTGYRVPSETEWRTVIANTTQTFVGTWNGTPNPNDYSAAVVFKSSRNSTVQLTLPSTLLRSGTNGALQTGGTFRSTWYWGNRKTMPDGNAFLLRLQPTTFVVTASIPNFGASVRCIADIQ